MFRFRSSKSPCRTRSRRGVRYLESLEARHALTAEGLPEVAVMVADERIMEPMPLEVISTGEFLGEEPTLYVKPGLEGLYEVVSDDQGRPVSEKMTMDTDGDEAYDLIQVTEYEYTGSLIGALRISEDHGADGVVDSRTSTVYSYNELGALTSIKTTLDSNADGVVDSSYSEETTYDANGNFIGSVSTEDTDGDGIANLIRTSATKYNDNGSIASAVATVDNDADGSIDFRSTDTYAYDSEGNAVSLTTEIDSNGDGTVDETYVNDLTIVYMMDGVHITDDVKRGGETGEILTTTEVGIDDPKGEEPQVVVDPIAIGDPIPFDDPKVGTAKITTVEDELGRVLSETVEHDTDGDGVIDLRTIAEYKYEGSNVASVRYSEDRGADGTIDFATLTSYLYNEGGLLLSLQIEDDKNGDGVVDARLSEAYTYDDQGRTETFELSNDEDGDGKADSTASYRYAYVANGSFASVKSWIDYNADGAVDVVMLEEYAYDEAGLPLTLTTHTDKDGDGVYEQTEVTDISKVDVPIEGQQPGDSGVVTKDPGNGGSTGISITGGPETQKTDTNGGIQTIGTGSPIMGDVNGDRRFNSTDLLLLFQAGFYQTGEETGEGQTGSMGPASWETGDWNGDQVFDSTDLALAMQQGYYESRPGDGVLLTDNESTGSAILGDVNGDQRFDSSDLLQVFKAAKYRADDAVGGGLANNGQCGSCWAFGAWAFSTSEAGGEVPPLDAVGTGLGGATWNTGDWNGDHLFNSVDLILAMQHGHYESRFGDGALLTANEPDGEFGVQGVQQPVSVA